MFQILQLLALVAFCLQTSGVQAHTYFAANLTAGESTTPIGTFKSYTHDGMWMWALNSTAAAGIESLEIVDKKGSVSAPTYISAVNLVPELNTTDATTGMLMLNGTFAPTDINAVVAESLDELAGHICMGHIYLRANTTTGKEPLLVPLEYQVNSKGETCEVATAPDDVVMEEAADPHANHGGATTVAAASSGCSALAAKGVAMLLTAGAVALVF